MRRLAVFVVILILAGCGGHSVAVPQRAAQPEEGHGSAVPQRAPQRLPYVAGIKEQAVSTVKKGLAMACDGPGYMEDARRMGASWVYNWRTEPWIPEGIEAVPMIWGLQHMQLPIGGNSSWLLGYNETNHASEANISPEAGAVGWRQIEDNNPERLLVAPALTSGALTWLVDWREAYLDIYGETPRVDALAAHCYYPSAAGCIGYLEDVIELADEWDVGGVWVTEFAVTGGTVDERIIRMWELVTWLQNNPRIARWAVFVNRSWCLRQHYGPVYDDLGIFDDGGEITELGRAVKFLPVLRGVQAVPYP